MGITVEVGLSSASSGLSVPTVTANAKGPNQINLTWDAVTNPGWGYKVEIQSDGDSRYSSWTDLTATLQNGFGYLPYWVTEGHYLDRSDGTGTITGTAIAPSSTCGSAAQFMAFSLKHNTLYNFRVRSYGKTDAGVATHSSYSSTASATTLNATAAGGTGVYKLRFVRTDGSDSNDGQTDSSGGAWATMAYAAGQVTAGTLVLVHSGTYTNDWINTANSGSYDGTNYDDKIILQAYPGETVTLDSTSTPSGNIVLIDQGYWVVDGITVHDHAESNDNAFIISGSRNMVANASWQGPDFDGGGYTPLVSGSYNTWHNSFIGGYWGTADNGSGTYMISGNYNIHQNCRINRIGHDGNFLTGIYNMFTNSLVDGGLGMACELQKSTSNHNLVEGIVAKDVATDPEFSAIYKPGIEVDSNYNTVRRCCVYDGASYWLELNALQGSSNHHNLIYNNTVYGNDSGFVVFDLTGGYTYETFANNILWRSGKVATLYSATYTGSVFNNNIFLGNDGQTDVIWTQADGDITLAEAESLYPSLFTNNKTTAPTYISEAGHDFHLQSTSYGLALAVAVTDSTWGTVVAAGDSLGAFNYYEIS